MKSLHSASANENVRYIYFGVEASNNNFEQENITSQSTETKLSDQDYQDIVSYYQQNPEAAKQLKNNSVNTEENALQEVIDEGGKPLSERKFASKEEATKALTKAGIGNIGFLYLYDGLITEMNAKKGSTLSGDLSKLNKNLSGLGNIRSLQFNQSKLSDISAPKGQAITGDLSHFSKEALGRKDINRINFNDPLIIMIITVAGDRIELSPNLSKEEIESIKKEIRAAEFLREALAKGIKDIKEIAKYIKEQEALYQKKTQK